MLRLVLASCVWACAHALPRNDAGVLRGAEEVLTQIAESRRSLQAGGLRPMGTRAAKIGCYENYGWEVVGSSGENVDPLAVEPPESGFVFGSTDGVDRSGWDYPRVSITATASDPLVHQCMRGCLGLDYGYFGIYNGADCICGTGPPTTSTSLACEPCEADIDGYECGAPETISVYRDFNRVWEAPRYDNYVPPPPPDMPAIHDGQYALTEEEMAQLFAKLDKDHTGTIAVNEMVDVFDLVENGAMTVRDCQGNMYPHRWVGDGFCDDGTETEDGAPDFNCATFECDRNDCATGCVASPEHDRVSLVPDTITAGNFGAIAQMGEVWLTKFWAVRGKTYTFVGQTGDQAQDLVPGVDGTWLTVGLKDGTDEPLTELELTTPGSVVATDPCSSPHCDGTATDVSLTCDLDPLTDDTAECPEGCDGDNWHGTDPCPVLNTWTNTGDSRMIYLETRVRRTDGVCAMDASFAGSAVTGSAVDHRGHCYVSVVDPASNGFTFEEARGACEAAGMTLASIRAPDQESFIETNLLRSAATAKYWIGAAKEPGTAWTWIDGLRFFWEDWETDQGAEETAACGALNHDSSHALDGWTSEDCQSTQPGFICLKDTELAVPEATGLFKLLVTTADGRTAAPDEPPLWSTVLWARSGYNSTVAAANGVFAQGPVHREEEPCKNLLDEQNGNSTQCQIMQEYGFDCLTYFCPTCEYAGVCDLACDFCGDELYLPVVEEPREELDIPEPEPEPWIDPSDPGCYDAYDHQGGMSVSQTSNQCDYYRASEPDYAPQVVNGALVGDAALCLLGASELQDATACESQMRTDAPTLPACVYTPAPETTSQCDMMLQSGFECATWMCRDPDICPYSGFCDRTCNFCLRADGYACTPLSATEGYFAQRAQTGNENCRGGACSADGCSSLPYCAVANCDVAWGDAQTNPNSSTCRACITGGGDCPTDCVCDPACDVAPVGAWCLSDAECETGNCDSGTTTCAESSGRRA